MNDQKCPECGGSGVRSLNGFEVDCRSCSGSGWIAAAPQAPSGQQAEPTDELTSFQRDLLRNLGASMAAERSRENGDAWEQLAELLRALAGQHSERPAPAGQPRPFAEVVQHNQGRYFTCLAAPGVDQPAIGAKVYLAAPAGQAVGAVYSATIKTKAQMRKDIPNDQRGWYCDVAYGQTLLLRDANAADLARCNLGDSHSKNPADWLCEVFPHGCLVDRRAVASMHVEEGICVAPAALAASQAERPAVMEDGNAQ